MILKLLSVGTLILVTACSYPVLRSESPTAVAVPASVRITPTTAPLRAAVTDLSVPFTSSEADALVPRGFLGNGAYGRLGIGCTVEIVKTTDRGALVKPVSCPQSDNTNVPSSAFGSVQGWVAKSALDIKP